MEGHTLSHNAELANGSCLHSQHMFSSYKIYLLLYTYQYVVVYVDRQRMSYGLSVVHETSEGIQRCLRRAHGVVWFKYDASESLKKCNHPTHVRRSLKYQKRNNLVGIIKKPKWRMEADKRE